MKLDKHYLQQLFFWIKGRDILFREAIEAPRGKKRNILLRHDVDNDLQRSFRMAQLEEKAGIRATYFILDTAPYWVTSDPRLWSALLGIAKMGHEIAWHNNVLTTWLQTRRPIDELVAEPLVQLRKHGHEIVGSASHGDKMCRTWGYVNYDVFEECPREGSGLNFPKHKTKFPKVSMKDFGLKYEAYHLHRDQYFSESGGKWGFIPEEKNFADEKLVTQILIHPQWWDL